MKDAKKDELNYCPSGGYLVGGKDWLPAAKTVYHFGGPGVTVGCNQLICGDCGAKVRSGQGWNREGELNPGTLYKAKDWGQCKGLKPGNATFYVCKCNYHFATIEMAMDNPFQSDIEKGVVLPNWRCGGHEKFSFPGTIAGVKLNSEEDVTTFTQRILAGAWTSSEPNPSHNGYPGFLLWRVYSLVKDAGCAELVSDLVLEALTDSSPLVRAVAIAFFKVFPDAPGAERLVSIFRNHYELFHGIPDPVLNHADLDIHFEMALQNRFRATGDRESLSIVRHYLLSRKPFQSWRFQLLQERDRAWVDTNRFEILTADPKLLNGWVYMIRSWPEEVLLKELKSIRRQTGMSTDSLQNAVMYQLQDDPGKRDKIRAAL